MTHVLGWLHLQLWLVSYVDDNTLLRTFPIGTPATTVIRDLTKMMRHWHRLLKITGGDLCLEKCKLSILSWNNTNLWGLPSISTLEEFPGCVSMDNTHQDHQEQVDLERIEPWQGERILGVRIPIHGTMTEELTYRQQQTQDMAKALRKAPFDPQDAWMVYESRYRAALRFPLPVTTFTEAECHSIQQPFIYQLLPKLGLNRHTPRSVIYGPKLLGGLELMDLRCEQPHLHYQATLGHIRRQDQAGKGLRINISDLQAEIGSAYPVFHLDYTRYNYGTAHTRMQYLWTTVRDHKCHLETWDDWVPIPQGLNDKNIMDVAVHDPYFANQYNYRLKIINSCRLYLGAIFLSDISHDGRVPPCHLDGSTFTPNPQVPRKPRLKPSSASWTEWKNFIFRNFLIYGYTLMDPITYTSTPLPRLSPRTSETDLLMLMYDTHRGGQLNLLVGALPSSLRLLLGTVQFPHDNGQLLATNIKSSTAVGATDGSVINSFKSLYGGHAATIQSEHHDIQSFTMSSPSPHSTEMSSTTTELYAYLAIVVMLHLLCIAHTITAGKIIIYIDNQEAGNRGNQDLDLINISDYLTSDYDLTILLRHLITSLPIDIQYVWVASHQDELPTGEAIHGPFQRHIQLNQQVDLLAAEGRNEAAGTITKKPLFSSTGMQLYTPTGIAITNWGQYLTDSVNGEKLESYYNERRGWTQHHLKLIDWEAMSLYLNKQRHTKRMKILQLQHGWQNTGSQKLTFLISTLQGELPDEATKTKNEVYCPFDCNEEEHRLHYMSCTSPIMVHQRLHLRQHLLRRLRNRNTSPLILSILSYILLELDSGQEPVVQPPWQHIPHHATIAHLFIHQQDLGWTSMLQGFIPHEWSILQQSYLRRNPRVVDNPSKSQKNGNSIETWKRHLVQELIQYSLDSWKHRNDQLHGALETTNRKQHRQQLIRRIHELYRESGTLTRIEDKKYFRLPCRLRVKQTNLVRLETWVNMVEMVLLRHHERVAREMIDPWHRHRPGMTRSP
jgi:hypothetical protein